MPKNQFDNPQRQSLVGVLLIFSTTLYKIGRVLWAVLIYEFISKDINWTWIGIGAFVVLLLAFTYSYAYYRRFLFYVNLEKQVFVLKKGIFATEEIQISFDKIQQVNTEQSILQRILNVHKLVVDTAGGKDKEVIIHALSKSRAEALSILLMETGRESQLAETSEEVFREKPKEKQPLWVYKIGVSTLLKLGISANQFRGAALILAFFSTIYQDLQSLFKPQAEQFDAYMNEVPNPLENLTLVLGFLLVLLVVSVLVTTVEVFIKYFNLKLERKGQYLQIEMGLKNSKKFSLQAQRVQILFVKTNPFQQKMNLYEMKMALANTVNSAKQSKISLPGLSANVVHKVTAFLYQNPSKEKIEEFKPHKIVLYRKLLFSAIPLVLSFGLFWWIPEFKIRWWIPLAGVYSLFVLFYQWRAYKNLKLSFSEGFLYKKSGVWTRVEARVELYKLQSISVATPYFYKRKHLVNLTFHTAGGDISFRAVNRDALAYVNYVLFKTEAGREAWM